MAKRARELAAKEKRERKLAKKAARAANRGEAVLAPDGDELVVTDEAPEEAASDVPPVT